MNCNPLRVGVGLAEAYRPGNRTAVGRGLLLRLRLQRRFLFLDRPFGFGVYAASCGALFILIPSYKGYFSK